MLLLAGTVDSLTDVGAFPDADSKFTKLSNLPGSPAQGDKAGATWALYNALSLALWSVWPTSQLESSLSMSSYGQSACVSFQTTRARWGQLSDASREQIVATFASAVARLYGMIKPDTATSTIKIAVRAVAERTSFNDTQQRNCEQVYLAETTIGLRRWSALSRETI